MWDVEYTCELHVLEVERLVDIHKFLNALVSQKKKKKMFPSKK